LLLGNLHRSGHRNQATSSGKWIAEWLPKHYAHEETTVLETIAKMSPELASFAREMKRQHNEMRVRLESFRDHLAQLDETATWKRQSPH